METGPEVLSLSDKPSGHAAVRAQPSQSTSGRARSPGNRSACATGEVPAPGLSGRWILQGWASPRVPVTGRY
jgi:hypothetical protein